MDLVDTKKGPYDEEDLVAQFHDWCREEKAFLLVDWPSWKLHAWPLLNAAYNKYQHCLYGMALDSVLRQTVHVYDPKSNCHFMVWRVMINYKWGETLAKEDFESPLMVFGCWSERDITGQPEWINTPIDRVRTSLQNWKLVVDYVLEHIADAPLNQDSSDKIGLWCEAVKFTHYFDDTMRKVAAGIPDSQASVLTDSQNHSLPAANTVE
ncbi:hypothetical protein EYR40_004842 [Pleurotus pulmonarius]|nr:hypothetical protein EYR36_006778 [Pleurotus pulmonarius]KAF4601472.1 hypothetical protein EYR38_006125 [Pleurotus pulmonarius]KAF4601643.1 hypothetical protein EYR40_004842 [Pleurotus pulmonarius]